IIFAKIIKSMVYTQSITPNVQPALFYVYARAADSDGAGDATYPEPRQEIVNQWQNPVEV
ncbi:hypothetical protein D7V95_03330, partial [bacterium J10(2018)]